MERARQLLRDLVAINSINPSLVPGAPGEGEAAACLADCLRESGLDVTITDVAPGRPNVVGVLEGAQPGPTLLLCGHLDTVGVEGMTDPFVPVERDGRLYGRGTQDMKAGVAACVGAARQLAAEGLSRGRLIVAGVVDEEYASLGAEALVRDWRADGAVITEPTDLSVGVAHKGFAWLEINAHGRAAHGSRPEEGKDAILAMGRVLGVLERFDQELRARPTHPLLGSGSLHASTITGGTEASVYPALCRLLIERRTLPGEDGARALHEVEQMLAVLRTNDPEFTADVRLVVERAGYDLDPAAELPQQLIVAGRARGLEARVAGMSYWTDAAILGGAGIPTVIFGPRGAGLHSTVEYVELASVDECAYTLAALARQFLG
ncbi:ArgE/DapE family deacylase [Luteitalea sp.]|jgi:acetylornithine deacetylase|uniref:ArgE/DapE family deacylase n=1 Tax=Luteitalea sp. TaxID=2004800 RepID=UPI0037C8C206